ncbi:uncharacterized protein LY89DRAFT_643510 [Mollisia scopiformis]|uniref:Phosphoglycerate mutase family protein n=1 Tax=Mollisia scopiformis TaxID=149040 RepID=A0A194XFI6_MOLSC|nr:uncharacterized protein LY89DRAFT_643510 [Mollisia scopiformis]KUJ18955.1 hypothetical protein LY89DRAFT_643510 [Mollisia scopiformis]
MAPKPTIYLIRHGEKPPKLPSGKDADGLSAEGLERAQGLKRVFGPGSGFDIGCIVAERPKKDGSRDRPYETIEPLAEELGVKVDKSIERDDAAEAAEKAKAYRGEGNVLVCWEHGVLGKIVEALGVPGGATYPGDRFDVIWSVSEPYDTLVWVGSEGIPGLDDGSAGESGSVGGVGPVVPGTE